MTAKAHRHCVAMAGGFSSPLRSALVRVGRVALPDPGRRSLPWFLCRAVAGQQLSTSAARTIWSRVEAAVKSRGSRVPEFFTERNAPLLRQCGLSRAKVKALMAIEAAHRQGALSVRRLRRMTHVERAAHLQRIWGVGQWTADMTSIFYFRDPDVWPEGDLAVQKTFQSLTRRRSKAAALKIAGAFAPYRSFLAVYMWRVLDEPGGTGRGRAPQPTKRPIES